jgi:hypothetical protein
MKPRVSASVLLAISQRPKPIGPLPVASAMTPSTRLFGTSAISVVVLTIETIISPFPKVSGSCSGIGSTPSVSGIGVSVAEAAGVAVKVSVAVADGVAVGVSVGKAVGVSVASSVGDGVAGAGCAPLHPVRMYIRVKMRQRKREEGLAFKVTLSLVGRRVIQPCLSFDY